MVKTGVPASRRGSRSSALSRGRPGRAGLALAVGVLALAGTASAVVGYQFPKDLVAVPADHPSTPAGSPTVAPLDRGSAQAVVAKYLVAVEREMAVRRDPRVRKFDAVATGPALAELEAQQSELDSSGWTRRGAVKVEKLTVVGSQLEAKPPTVVVQACMDSTRVSLHDAKGVPVKSTNRDSQRSANTVTLQYLGGRWLVVERSFPKDPSC